MATYSLVDNNYLSLSNFSWQQSLCPVGISETSSDLNGTDGLMNYPLVISHVEPVSHSNQAEPSTYNSSDIYTTDTSAPSQAGMTHRPWIPVNAQNFIHDHMSQVTSSTLFSDLQSALPDKCNTKCSTAPTTPVASVSNPQTPSPSVPLSVSIGHLHKRFMAVAQCHKSKATELDQFYRYQSADIETARYTKLQSATPYNPWIASSINAYYDHIHQVLIDRVVQSLDLLNDTVSTTKVKTNSKDVRSIQLSHQSLPQDRPADIKPNMDNSPPSAGQCKPLYRRKGFLNPVAVRIMSTWYENNSEHPYPSYEAAQVMAKAGDITVDQVKKWFANHRRRSNNTKPMKEIAHRRKILKRSRSCMESAADDIFLTEAKRSRDS